MTVAHNLVGMRSPSAEATVWRPQSKLRPLTGCSGTGTTLEDGQSRQVSWVGQVCRECQDRMNSASKETENVKNGISRLLDNSVEEIFFKMMPASALVPKESFNRPLSLWYFP